MFGEMNSLSLTKGVWLNVLKLLISVLPAVFAFLLKISDDRRLFPRLQMYISIMNSKVVPVLCDDIHLRYLYQLQRLA